MTVTRFQAWRVYVANGMKRIPLILFFPLLLAAQPAPGRGPARNLPRPPTRPEDLCVVEGQVLNALSGEVLGKARLSLRPAGGQGDMAGVPRAYFATSDPSGKFAIPGVEPGTYRLTVSRTGFVDRDYGTREFVAVGAMFTLRPGQRMANAVLRMMPNAVITGRVVDEDGEPMARVQLQAVRVRYTQGGKHLAAMGSASSNDIGEYRISGLPPGRYYVSASARGLYMADQDDEYVPVYYPGSVEFTGAAPLDLGAGGQLRGVDLALSRRRTVRIRGRVINPSGPAVLRQRISLSLMRHDGMELPSQGPPSTVDAEGRFEIRGVMPGSYNLIATILDREAILSARVPVDAGNANIENVAVTVRPPLTIRGRVRVDGQEDTGLPNVSVTLTPVETGPQLYSRTSAGVVQPDGSFTVPDLGPDRYRLSLSAPDGYYLRSARMGDHDVLAADLDLTGGPAAALDIVLRPNAGQVAGLVQNEQQQPAAEAAVVAVPQERERASDFRYYKTTFTDSAGRFSFKNLDPGDYKIYAWQEVEAGAWMDPEFLRPVEDRGQAVSIREGSQETVQLRLAP